MVCSVEPLKITVSEMAVPLEAGEYFLKEENWKINIMKAFKL